MTKRVIFTADDFGLDLAVNEAVERAHREGVLTSASLMVTAPAAADAIARARRMPGLAVGLHLVLVQGEPALEGEAVRALIRPDGAFLDSPAQAGLRYFFHPGARRALASEIRAQFEAFRRTGLPLDHVDGHTHLHIHPTIFSLLMEIGPEYGMRAMRVPFEPASASAQAAGDSGWGRFLASGAFQPWAAHMKSRLRRNRIAFNDLTFGLFDSGRMEERLMIRQLEAIPAGKVAEIYCHPAVAQTNFLAGKMAGYRNVAEYQALISPGVAGAIDRLGITRVAFGNL